MMLCMLRIAYCHDLRAVQAVANHEPPPSGLVDLLAQPTAYLTITNTSFQNNTETDVSCQDAWRHV